MERQLVVFTLAGEYYGVSIFLVERIIDMQPIAFVPKSPPFVKGVIHISGLMLPVLDLRQRFDLPALPPNRGSRIVLVSVEGSTVGMIVDGVAGVVRVADGEIVRLPDLVLTPINRVFVTGVVQVGTLAGEKPGGRAAGSGQTVVLLDLPRVLSAAEVDELRAFEQVWLAEL